MRETGGSAAGEGNNTLPIFGGAGETGEVAAEGGKEVTVSTFL